MSRSDVPALVAHRGFADEYPENTLFAFESAAERADVIELDVRRSESGELVVFHDAELSRLTDAHGLVEDTPWSELRELAVLDSGERIPGLDTALDAIPDEVGVNVELKHGGMTEQVLAAVEGVENEVLFSSFEGRVLRELRERETAASLGCISRRGPNCIDTALGLECESVHPRADICDADFVTRAHEVGLDVNVWTIETRAEAERLATAGVDGLIADTWRVLLRG
ncbi:glycerophosphodiester phosphodiesterase [Haladaptatus halobius]|uniref:glycerophosphodiester phosphodiesterase n=1 Tax=Haladaptatus halobius TaxID=2884875 RepID=UPI001D09A952|nr:glycerophosphodiester phosphodiesterase family protein [Haladaptatus halobius]